MHLVEPVVSNACFIKQNSDRLEEKIASGG